jgi:transcriptional regulator of acetoin/glycerol metabolism
MSATTERASTDIRLWERFQSGHCSDHEVERSPVLRRWLRCRQSGLSADNPGEPRMALARLGDALETFGPLLAPGAPFDAFATKLATAGYCGVLCDSDGVVVARHIAEPFESTIAESRLVEGAVWSEDARGTNGMGTALFEREPVAIVGVEHFELRNHGLACYAAPVRDIRARIVGVLDATGPATSAAHFIQVSVVATAAAIEALIVARTYDAALPGGLFEIERLLARLAHPTLLIESTGHLRRSNARFDALHLDASRFELAGRLGTSLTRQSGQGPARFDDLPGPLRGMVAEIEPLGQAEDPFAAIVHLQPRHRRVHAPGPQDPVPAAFTPIVGSDPAVVAARSRAARFARTDLPFLLVGETGVGKEVFARSIHAGSERRHAPFVAVNCGALAASLLESELFGYGPGAFTGASPGGRTGKLAAAHGGTLFLDEVGEMTAPAQAAMLRFLEDGTYYRVGEAAERRADVRLIAATSRDLPDLVKLGRFRSDLYFRLRGVVLRLPALRERSDRRELALALLARIARDRGSSSPIGLSLAALAWIERHDWPGNVRELRSALNYAAVLAEDAPRIELWHLPIEEPAEPPRPGDLRATSERTAVLHALSQSRGNLSGAARSLGVARSTLYRMLARHALRPGEDAAPRS